MGISAGVMIITGVMSLVSGSSVAGDNEGSQHQRKIQADKPSAITITVLYNNVSHDPRLATAWGKDFIDLGCGAKFVVDAYCLIP